MLVLTVGLNVLGKSKAGAFSIAASLTSMIYALGDVSGAHFNPAVTVAILASGRCPDLTPSKAAKFIGVQIPGGSQRFVFVFCSGRYVCYQKQYWGRFRIARWHPKRIHGTVMLRLIKEPVTSLGRTQTKCCVCRVMLGAFVACGV